MGGLHQDGGGDAQQQRAVVSVIATAAQAVAAGAVVLYAVGVVRAAGRLDASGVSAEAVFRVTSLDQHLLTGVGLVIQPDSLWITGLSLVLFGLIGWLVRFLTENSALRRGFILIVVSLTGLALFFGAVQAILVMFLVAAAFAPEAPQLQRIREFRWAVVLVVYLVGLALIAYHAAEPLPPAVIQDKSGADHRGALLGVRDGFVYLRPVGERHEYVALAQDEARLMRVGRAPDVVLANPSLFRLLGLGVGQRACHSDWVQRGHLCVRAADKSDS